jgi:hypothetical protein
MEDGWAPLGMGKKIIYILNVNHGVCIPSHVLILIHFLTTVFLKFTYVVVNSGSNIKTCEISMICIRDTKNFFPRYKYMHISDLMRSAVSLGRRLKR